MLTTRRYTLERGEWDSRELQARLNSGYFNTEVLREETVHRIAPERVDDVVEELLLRWPMSSLVGSITSRMRVWFRNRGRFFSPASNEPCITDRKLESMLLKKAGSLRVPLREVPKAIRREQRRRRIHEATRLRGEAINHTIPLVLVDRWGDKFQIATVDEARLRVSPSCLVWAYDVKKYGWWKTVPKGIDPVRLSVFGLAIAVEGIRSQAHTLSASCYSCTEDDVKHRGGRGCERCESPWDLEEFWEWLRSRHFCETRSFHSDGVPTFRDLADEIVNSIGFAPPGRNGARRVSSPWECDPTLFCVSSQTVNRRIVNWWSWTTRAADQSSDGLCRWEFERILLYRLAELDRQSGTDYLSAREFQ
ncbi:hypothetical protein GNI_000040 [Gregarina niphandrodes]|uniref:Uncharacterized protein n=1 Tax=Gregarina niphandrodes TaxID=110365 RepID=A0A023BE70_GRENI|nr:hypothetical protein GNI_000040 [Gregarina niphandrodes]EZG89861.1 hypothetical protein GNI_000040 [Gregarina niphandrodes]|eukprot:XP_011128434.1 hypothetical protein GNI_000040 [Gregarina niphandrodes]